MRSNAPDTKEWLLFDDRYYSEPQQGSKSNYVKTKNDKQDLKK